MKKFFMMMAMAAIALFTVTACGDDDDDKGGNESSEAVPVLTKAPYAEQAVALNINSFKTPKSSKYAALKRLNFLESGTYMLELDVESTSARVTRAGGSSLYEFGKFTYSGGTYKLDNGLEITLTKSGSSYEIVIKLKDGTTIECTGSIIPASGVTAGIMTDNLCSRPWTIETVRVRIIDKDGAVFSRDFSAPFDLDAVKKWAESNGKGINDKIETNTVVTGINFGSDGFFAITYTNRSSDVGSWRWRNIADGILGYNWDDTSMGLSVLTGEATVAFTKSPERCKLTLKGKIDNNEMEFVFTLK
jgi:hypothetical protein